MPLEHEQAAVGGHRQLIPRRYVPLTVVRYSMGPSVTELTLAVVVKGDVTSMLEERRRIRFLSGASSPMRMSIIHGVLQSVAVHLIVKGLAGSTWHMAEAFSPWLVAMARRTRS